MLRQVPRQLSHRTLPSRTFSTRPRHQSPSNPFQHTAAPPRLPKEEQEIFERLQRQSTGAFSTPREIDAELDTAPGSKPSLADLRARINQSPNANETENVNVVVEEVEEDLHPHVRRGAKPEFEGERNPKTGEVGGPKNEPLRWGAGGDWSFNGRVTDF
ncbi:hypothetical protein GQ43DRAFT_361970 [Delitschia confertaspora ATCC 74209]|uniref:Succinate dehydrogenase assembly factor 4, mitochondrial n=1 Tax=Delitschia confertaspora ATCC 74209 TaxID=1513339 RepID=A0A9P4JWG7_9PLEO|nr:hypothetical protein GQ43DRAFT_361970 [Delitschia confertaspora ATCC 74209]